MSLTTAQKEAAIEAASRIVVALIENSQGFKQSGNAATDSSAAVDAFKKVFEQIKASAS
ncbi:hypothetical protein [Xanthomonas sp. WHRI 7945]|nr:hypothetical protein [Xanthomonas campestris pv. campestris]